MMARLRVQLVERVASLIPESNVRVTMVFDGQSASEETAEHGSRVDVVFTGAGQTADAYIERLAGHLREPREAIVVSSDRAVVEGGSASGCQVMTARGFLELLGREGQAQKRSQARQKARSPRGPRLGDFFPSDSD